MNDTFEHKRKKIISAIRAIPNGKVASYGQIASIAGIARGHRLVARVLREDNGASNLPWYRVIRADGRCGMSKDSNSYIKQFSLLKLEAVLSNNGKIDMKRYQWQTDLDTFLFRPHNL